MGERHVTAPRPAVRAADWRVLEEGDGALGIVLWQELRHLRDWVLTPPPRRRGLLDGALPRRALELRAAAREEAPELAGALEALATVRAGGADSLSGSLADAAERVARWAEGRGARETAVEFADLAALLEPECPARANLAGRLSRLADEYARAELWFERGIALARRADDRLEYTRGHIGSGILYLTLARDEDARRHLRTASVAARRDGRHWLAAEAQHDLMLVLTDPRTVREAIPHAHNALSWYPKHHPRFPYFAADYALLLVVSSQPEPAVRILDAFLDVVPDPRRNALGRSVLVRALASTGDAARFRRERARVRRLLCNEVDHGAPTRFNLAAGELLGGLRAAATLTARDALRVATKQGEAIPGRYAAEFLADLEGGGVPRLTEPAPVPDFSQEICSRLMAWSPTRRGRARTAFRGGWAA